MWIGFEARIFLVIGVVSRSFYYILPSLMDRAT